MLPISVDAFLTACQAIQAAKPAYKLGHDGDDGYCDCIGLVIGAIRRAGGKWTGTHGSNYAARYEMQELIPITSATQLEPGMAVYKAREPGDAKYSLPNTYNAHPDQRDYYHVGVVISVAPLRIMHCTSWSGGSGIKVDTTLGAWKWGGRLIKVAYDGQGGGDTMDMLWVGKVTGGRLALRAAADKNVAVLMWLPDGAQVKVLDKFAPDGWVYVEYNGKRGYCMRQYLQNIEDEPDSSSQAGGDKVTITLSRTAAKELLEALRGQIT